MAALSENITLSADAWTQITDGETTGDISVYLLSGGPIVLRGTASASEPSGTDGMLLVKNGHGWSEATIAEKFPGVSGADHLYGRALLAGVVAEVYISGVGAGAGGGGPSGDALLLESGDFILLEDGSFLLLE